MSETTERSANIALVTAGSKRLGRAICIKLAELGYDIALHYNSSENEAQITAREVQKAGRRCELFKRNFRNFDEVLTLMSEVISRLGKPNLLVNNASTFDANTLRDAKPEEFDADFQVHVKAPFFLIRDFANHCQAGQIINIVDASIARHGSGYVTYHLSKKTLADLTFMAAKELAPKIRVNAIAPGVILRPVGWDQDKSVKASTQNILGRAAGPDDVLAAMEYLLKAEQVTGDCLYVDGGDHVEW